MRDDQYRRLFGVLLGAGLGLSYGFVSQTINHVMLPGLPLLQPPLGLIGNIGLCVLTGACLGLACSWFSEGVISIFSASALGVLGVALYLILVISPRPSMMVNRAVTVIFLSLFALGGFAPPLAIYRWMVSKQVEARANADPVRKRLWLPLALLVAAGVMGGFSLYSPAAQTTLSAMNNLIQAGLKSPDASVLPPPFQSESIPGFLDRAVGSYSLEWTNSNINQFGIPRRATGHPGEESVVIARFENEWTLICLFPTVDAEPSCKGLGGRKSSFAVHTRIAPHPFEVEWDDRALFREGLVQAEQRILDRLPGASVYHIDLKIPDDLSQVQGLQQVRYTNQEDRALNEIYFRLFPNASGGKLTLAEVKVDGQTIQPVYEFNNTAIRVPLAHALLAGECVVIELDFTAQVPREMGGNYGLFVYHDSVLALDEFYPVIPVYDDEGWNVETPPPNADSSYFDVSFYLARVTAPARLTVVGSGIEIGHERQGNDQLLTFAAGPARDFYLVASERYTLVSEQVGEITVNSYAPVERVAEAELALHHAASALQKFSPRFGVYPYTELDIASTPMTALGVEYPGVAGITLKMYDPDAEIGGGPATEYLEGTIAHEVGHQWFYNVVGNDQVDEPWLDEAIAEYITGLYYLDIYGEEGWRGYRYYAWVQRWKRIDMAKIPIGLPARDYAEKEYSPIVYGRGALFLEQLAKRLSQKTFDEFMRDYYESHKWGIGTTQEFRQLAEKHCQCDLTDLFEAWVYKK